MCGEARGMLDLVTQRISHSGVELDGDTFVMVAGVGYRAGMRWQDLCFVETAALAAYWPSVAGLMRTRGAMGDARGAQAPATSAHASPTWPQAGEPRAAGAAAGERETAMRGGKQPRGHRRPSKTAKSQEQPGTAPRAPGLASTEGEGAGLQRPRPAEGAEPAPSLASGEATGAAKPKVNVGFVKFFEGNPALFPKAEPDPLDSLIGRRVACEAVEKGTSYGWVRGVLADYDPEQFAYVGASGATAPSEPPGSPAPQMAPWRRFQRALVLAESIEQVAEQLEWLEGEILILDEKWYRRERRQKWAAAVAQMREAPSKGEEPRPVGQRAQHLKRLVSQLRKVVAEGMVDDLWDLWDSAAQSVVRDEEGDEAGAGERKRGRGRPRKNAPPDPSALVEEAEHEVQQVAQGVVQDEAGAGVQKRGQGRPRKGGQSAINLAIDQMVAEAGNQRQLALPIPSPVPGVRPRSRFEGVLWDEGTAKWRVQIRVLGCTVFDELYEDEVAAARMYNRTIRVIQADVDSRPINFLQLGTVHQWQRLHAWLSGDGVGGGACTAEQTSGGACIFGGAATSTDIAKPLAQQALRAEPALVDKPKDA
eukprot:gene699-1157_t